VKRGRTKNSKKWKRSDCLRRRRRSEQTCRISVSDGGNEYVATNAIKGANESVAGNTEERANAKNEVNDQKQKQKMYLLTEMERLT
jgi:hypothetical protein